MPPTDSVLGVIPARGGSTRIPGKNLKNVGETPLVGRAIEQARAATELDEFVVSTDDSEIGRVATDYGARVPFQRPAELASDHATSTDVVEHALDWFDAHEGKSFDIVVMLLPTAPLRTPEDVDGAIERLRDDDAGSVISLSKFETPPHWAVEMDSDHRLTQHFSGPYLWSEDGDSQPRSQDLPTVYTPNGAVFVAWVDAFRDEGGFYTSDTAGYIMPRERSVDIDEPYDLEVARALVGREREPDTDP